MTEYFKCDECGVAFGQARGLWLCTACMYKGIRGDLMKSTIVGMNPKKDGDNL